MKKYILTCLIILGIAGTASASWYNPFSWFQGEINLGALPYFMQTGSMLPGSDTINNNIGTTSPANKRYNGFFKNIQIDGTCTGCASGGSANALTYWTSGTTMGATTSPTIGWITATSTTATSTFNGNLYVKGNQQVDGSLFAPITFTAGSVALTSLTLTNPLGVASGGTGQTSFGQGWLNSDGTTLTSSTSPTVNYLTATSTTATSTFAGGMNVAGSSGLTVLQNGNVGIGTAAPGVKLQVSGDTRLLGAIQVKSDGSNTLFETNTSNYLVFYPSQTGGGGIWFTQPTPTNAVHFGSAYTESLAISHDATNNIGSIFGYTNSGQAPMIRLGSTSATSGHSLSANDVLVATKLEVDDTAYFDASNSIITSGNVGIGTTSPASILHVSAGASATTTVDFGAQSTSAKTCFNVRSNTGAATSFYFVGTSMIIEAQRCN